MYYMQSVPLQCIVGFPSLHYIIVQYVNAHTVNPRLTEQGAVSDMCRISTTRGRTEQEAWSRTPF